VGFERETCPLRIGKDIDCHMFVNCQKKQGWWVKFMVKCW